MILDLHVTGISQETGVFWAVVYGHDLCALSQKAMACPLVGGLADSQQGSLSEDPALCRHKGLRQDSVHKSDTERSW